MDTGFKGNKTIKKKKGYAFNTANGNYKTIAVGPYGANDEYIKLIKGDTYVVSGDTKGYKWLTIIGYNQDKSFNKVISIGTGKLNQSYTFVADCDYIRVGAENTSNVIISNKTTPSETPKDTSEVPKDNNTNEVISQLLSRIKKLENRVSKLESNNSSTTKPPENSNPTINTDSSTTKPSSTSLSGTYLFFGDSICYGGGTNGYGYPQAIKAKEPGVKILNHGVCGTCIAKNNTYDVKYPSILSKIQNTAVYADYIVLEGGLNDSWGNRNPLGEFKEGSAPTTSASMISYEKSLNEYEFCDALEKCIIEIKLKWWGKKIFYVIPHRINEAYSKKYFDTAIQICKKWGVKVIDIRNSEMQGSLINQYTVDGTHPNKDGYDKYYAPFIINTLK